MFGMFFICLISANIILIKIINTIDTIDTIDTTITILIITLYKNIIITIKFILIF